MAKHLVGGIIFNDSVGVFVIIIVKRTNYVYDRIFWSIKKKKKFY